MPGYHVHVDAEQLDAAFEAYLTGPMAFWRSDFSHEIEQHEGYEPAHHLTRKPSTSVEFRRVFADVVDYVTRHPSAMRGYIEGEFIAIDDDFETGPFDPTVPMPFALTMTSLLGARFARVKYTSRSTATRPTRACARISTGWAFSPGSSRSRPVCSRL